MTRELSDFLRPTLVVSIPDYYAPYDRRGIDGHRHVREINELTEMALDYSIMGGGLDGNRARREPDLELHIEELAKMRAAVKVFGEKAITFYNTHRLVLPDSREALTEEELYEIMPEGSVLNFATLYGKKPDTGDGSDWISRPEINYYDSPVFAKFAGRRFELAGWTSDMDDMPDELLEPTIARNAYFVSARMTVKYEIVDGEVVIVPPDDRPPYDESKDKIYQARLAQHLEWEKKYKAAAERFMASARPDYERPDNVLHIMRKMIRDDGITDFVIKATSPKKGFDKWNFSDFSRNDSYEDIRQRFYRAGNLTSPHGGIRSNLYGANTMLVQEMVPMGYEYRFFVVNHELVAGAGCVDNNTPLDSQHAQFDPVVEKDRYAPGQNRLENWDESIQGVLVDCAREIVAATHELEPNCPTYVVDVAINLETGEPLMIERNQLDSAGLYALDAERVAVAMRDFAAQYPGDPQLSYAIERPRKASFKDMDLGGATVKRKRRAGKKK
jgi:hypothetical protein